MLNALRRDARRYEPYGGWYRNLGFWVIAAHRLGHFARRLPLPLRFALLLVHGAIMLPVRLSLHVVIPSRAHLGAGLLLQHPYSILIPADSFVGADCTIYHDVTLGAGSVPGVPRIGDRVVLFVGSRVLGGVTIGEETEVGANAVVTRSVPPHSLVLCGASRRLPKTLRVPPAEKAEGGEAPVEPKSATPGES